MNDCIKRNTTAEETPQGVASEQNVSKSRESA